MNALILEDELPAANRLQRLIKACDASIRILGVLDSVESAAAFLSGTQQPDLLFADIHLADGLSFELFRRVRLPCPVIFTTAYDEYALRAFKLNSVDYLLKPVDQEELQQALQKFRQWHQQGGQKPDNTRDEQILQQLLAGWGKPRFRQRFLIRRGERLDYVLSEQVAFVYSDGGLTHLVDRGGQRDLLDKTLDQLEQELDPALFYRISRKCLVALPAIRQMHKYFSGRLKLDLQPTPPFDVFVSRNRVEGFQEWLDR